MNGKVEVVIPLRQWIQEEGLRDTHEQQANRFDPIRVKNQSILRKTTVAYGIVELLRNAKVASLNPASTPMVCSVDNFAVQVNRGPNGQRAKGSWNNVVGVGMIEPTMHAQISEPSFLGQILDDGAQENMGMYLEVDIFPPLPEGIARMALGQANESYYCQGFGVLLYELYSGMPPPPTEIHSRLTSSEQADGEPARKKSTVRYDKKKGKSYSTTQQQSYTSLQELGFHSSICLLVKNLIAGNNLYPSLEEASKDIHLLLMDPDCYISDILSSTTLSGRIGLKVREGKLYGREKEISLITDAFCRVSAGTNEAFFLGGYSGSGKTMLVDSLTARVDISGGYVLTQKVDQMSKDRPLLEVLAAFNNLCIMIKDKRSFQELLSLSAALVDEFKNDFDVLVRLLPNVMLLCPQIGLSQGWTYQQMHLAEHVQFTLQRFMRVVSTESNPVVLFLDDCQWAGSPALDLIHAILTDTRGSTCFFFVGTYRDNEVDVDHPLMELMASLDLASIETSHVNLSGLSSGDLNIMVAESLCIFPRIVKPLSDIIFEKTYGNPFFALEFLKSLVDSRLLKYSLREQQWIWDLDRIRSENITDNVLHLLSNKMASLPDNVQVAVKVLSCFGIKTDEAIVEHLCLSTCYPDFRKSLDRAISERCIQKKGSDFKFIHDKVREAAYELLPQHERRQFHHHLGVQLLSMAKNADLGSNVIFQIADQFNQDLTLVDPDMLTDVSELNVRAGSTAMDLSDFTTASSYLTNAHSLLPEDCWEEKYEFTMRLHYLSAKAAYSSGHSENAILILKAILDKGRCMEDKLDAHLFYLAILNMTGKMSEAFSSCRDVLLQLNETIPDTVEPKIMDDIIKKTERALKSIPDEHWPSMKRMENTSSQAIIKLYNLMCQICYLLKPEIMPFLCCKIIHITLENGLCSESGAGLSWYASILCQKSHIHVEGATRIGKVAMKLLELFNVDVPRIYYLYYGFVALHTESPLLCMEMCLKGYKVGMSRGDSAIASYNGILAIRFGMFGGENLPSLLEESDSIIEQMARFDQKVGKRFVGIYREVIATLIGNGANPFTAIQDEETAGQSLKYDQLFSINRALQSFWLGYTARCSHYVDKLLAMEVLGSHNRIFILFFGALNAFRGVKSKRNGSGSSKSKFPKVRRMYKEGSKLLKSASETCSPNFANKLRLLEAEFYSFEQKNDAAKTAYEDAISLSQSNKFIHEQGLSAELAGIHFQRIGDNDTAVRYFNEAKECYEKWGSQMKVGFITGLLGKIQT